MIKSGWYASHGGKHNTNTSTPYKHTNIHTHMQTLNNICVYIRNAQKQRHNTSDMNKTQVLSSNCSPFHRYTIEKTKRM